MNELLNTIDWGTVIPALLSVIWTGILVPIGKQVYEYLKLRKLDKYGCIAYEEVVKAVKSVQQALVEGKKGTDEWDEEYQAYIKDVAKDKAIQALTSSAYRALKEANADLEAYLDSLIDTALFDIKHKLV